MFQLLLKVLLVKAAGMPINRKTLFILDLIKESLINKDKIKLLQK